jgi:hypothetical protein
MSKVHSPEQFVIAQVGSNSHMVGRLLRSRAYRGGGLLHSSMAQEAGGLEDAVAMNGADPKSLCGADVSDDAE